MNAAITAYIELNPEIRFGKPILRGTHTTVAEVLEMLASGMSAEDIREDFPPSRPGRCGPACCMPPTRKVSCWPPKYEFARLVTQLPIIG